MQEVMQVAVVGRSGLEPREMRPKATRSPSAIGTDQISHGTAKRL
jgi:hypothetical protein